MAIDVYTLKNAMIISSVEEYLEMKSAFREQKKKLKKEAKEAAKRNAEMLSMQREDAQNAQTADDTPLSGSSKPGMPLADYEFSKESELQSVKMAKERRTVFVTTTDTAQQALRLAGISYEGEINLEEIQFSKIETMQNCMCGHLHIPRLSDVLGEKFRLMFIVNRKNIVIIDDSGFADKIIRRIISSRTKPGQSRERFLYSFCTKFMDTDLENLGRYSKKIMQLENDIFEDDNEDVIADITTLRKELLELREYYDELRDFGKMLEENENHFFSGKNLEYFGIISDRADRLMGRTMYLLDYVGQLRESYQGKVAERQSDNMKFLTIMSTIFYPLTLITGWYGMNFNNMPELQKGYPYVIMLSILVIGIVFAVCKKRKIF